MRKSCFCDHKKKPFNNQTKMTLNFLFTSYNFCTVLLVYFCKHPLIFKGPVWEHSSVFCVTEADFDFGLCLLIPLLVVWASSFLLLDCETTRMLLIPAQAHPQHLFCIWQIWEQKFFGEKMMVVWCFKFKLFTRILPLSFDPNHPITPSLSSLPPEPPFPPPLLFSAGWSPNKVTSSCIVGEIVKFSLSPCGSDLAIISSNCDCNTGTDWNRLASYFSSGSVWAYLNI